MDPASLVGLVASVAQLINVTMTTIRYLNDVKDAPKARAKLAKEVTYLLTLFTDLKYRLDESNPTDPWFQGLCALAVQDGLLENFKATMEDLSQRLAPRAGVKKLGRSLIWTFDRKEIDSVLSKVERLKSNIDLALQKDHFKLSEAIKNDVSGAISEIQGLRVDDERAKIEKWLAAPDPSSNHNSAQLKRQAKTGEWFTQSNEYAQWKTRSASFIWLHGIPGSGKTVLCSTIVKSIVMDIFPPSGSACAYFYFDFNDLSKQQTQNMVRSIIAQLMAQLPHIPDVLNRAYAQSHNGQRQPSSEELEIVLHNLMSAFHEVFVVLDALDECSDRDVLLDTIEKVISWNISGLHMLATSRKEYDIELVLQSLVTCQISIQNALVDRDIQVYIQEKLKKDPKLKKWPVPVQQEILEKLLDGAQGMFRWVACQLDSLRKCIRLDALRKALASLPKTLDETYERILSTLDEDNEADALKMLQWLCFSKHPIRLNEMVDILATDSTQKPYFKSEQRIPEPQDILTICSTLVTLSASPQFRILRYKSPEDQSLEEENSEDQSLEEENSEDQSLEEENLEDESLTKYYGGEEELKLAHFSVKEYLVSDRIKSSSMSRYYLSPHSSNMSITRSCVAYLLHLKESAFSQNDLENYPFYRYAARFWTDHYRSIGGTGDRKYIDLFAHELITHKPGSAYTWLELYIRARHIFRLDGTLGDRQLSGYDIDASPLYLMSLFGCFGLVQLLIDKGVDVNATDGNLGNVLQAACHTDHKSIVQLLIDRGANVNAQSKERVSTALLTAISCNNEQLVGMLIENGANVNAQGGFYSNALRFAAAEGAEQIVSILIKNGADVNAQGGFLGNALRAASYNDYHRIVGLLLDAGAAINAVIKGETALYRACVEGQMQVVKTLLDRGANVNVEGINVLAAAASCWQRSADIVQILLDKGVDVSLYGGEALHKASGKGLADIVQLLLDAGVPIDTVIKSKTALYQACCYGYEQVVEILLDRGANVNVEGINVLAADASFWSRENTEIIQILLDKGVNVSLYGGEALCTASERGFEDTVQLLLDAGAPIDAVIKDETALYQACCYGYEQVVEILLDRGANVNIKGVNVLAAASGWQANADIVQKLLDKGVDVSLYGKKALRQASIHGHKDIAELLKNHGAVLKDDDPP